MYLGMMWTPHSQKSLEKPKKIKSPKTIKETRKLDDNRCRRCGSYKDIGVHHIVNRSLGGMDVTENLITLCFFCHRECHDGIWDLIKWLEDAKDAKWFRWEEALARLKRRR